MIDEVPMSLPLVPLYDEVLLPSMVTKIVLEGNEAKSLLRKMENNDHSFIVCLPFIETENQARTNNNVGGLFAIGCVANVLDLDSSASYQTVFLVQGVCRAHIQDIHGQDTETALLDTTVEQIGLTEKLDDDDMGLWTRTIRTLCMELIDKIRTIGVATSVLSPFRKRLDEFKDYSVADHVQLSDMAYLLLFMIEPTYYDKLVILGSTNYYDVLERIQTVVTRHMQKLTQFKHVQQKSEEKCNTKRGELYTRQQVAYYGDEEVTRSLESSSIITGLSVSQSGCGEIFPIMAYQVPGNGQFKLTGSPSDAIKKSAQIAVSWVKANASCLELTETRRQMFLSAMDLHLHIPNAEVCKNGSSTGIAIAMCIVSLLSRKPVLRTTAIVGELTLCGEILPVGCINEMFFSAHRSGVTKVILPATNQGDIVQEVSEKVKNDLMIIYCRSIWEVLGAVFDNKVIQDNQFLPCHARL